ncbi:MAG: family 20 glycosylhydrolase [Planctomycetes bacterium]|nr:family 20 glycosylhydrolase [Planctomycetota bacterium]
MPAPARLDLLLPLPRKVELRPGAFELSGALVLSPPPGFKSPALERLRAELERREIALGFGPRTIELVLDGRSGHPREGYGLTIEPQRVRVIASKGIGLNHGLRTLTQLVRVAEKDWITTGPLQEPGAFALPALAIEDSPAFERRGVMLDVSRDRVPRMDYLFRLVELLAEWKLNELQLYFEHAFAYREHELVWRGVDPFTHDEIRALDRHCAAHGIELVPNQQSFGHLHHWLKHERYRHLAEVPEGIVHPFLGAGETRPEPFSLCPTDPRSLEFLAGLYDELLPCFTSGDFNVGLDETIDLGPGRSAAALRAQGVGRVYLDFLKSVHGLVSARGKRMQFWADILLNHPELVPEVPKDAVACLWGYEADHPFEQQTRTLADAGLPFYVCPGTSSWLSIGGRLENMLANVRSAAEWGAARGAKGLLITDWGDRGHLQPPCVSWPGFMTAADHAWNPTGAAHDADHGTGRLASQMDLHVFECGSPGIGVGALELAHVAQSCGVSVRNASALSMLLTKFDQPFPPPELASLSLAGLRRAESFCTGAALWSCVPRSPDGVLARRELAWVARTLNFACTLGEWRVEAGRGRTLEDLEDHRRAGLAAVLEPLLAEHRSLWLERSRPGGLDRSARWLERILAALRT